MSMQPTPHDDLTCPNYREAAALRKRVEELERSIDAHHAAHVMRRQPGDVCPVCSPVVPLPQKYGDEIPKSLDMADLCQAAVVRAEKAERERDELMENHQALGREYEAQGRVADKLQANLDAALDWIASLEGPGGPPASILALLEKRRENRG